MHSQIVAFNHKRGNLLSNEGESSTEQENVAKRVSMKRKETRDWREKIFYRVRWRQAKV
jgi:hypothetical protein